MKTKSKFFITAALALALVLSVTGVVMAADLVANKTIPLNNDTAGEGTDCPATGGPYWHFVISPNNNHSYFIVFHLNLGDAATYNTSIFVPNGSQLDNVFVAVPAGKTLTSLIKDGSSADIYWDGVGSEPDKFQLSHVCPGTPPTPTPTPPPATPPTVSKTAAGIYDNTYAWTITKEVDKTVVKQFGGTATFNYTVTVTYDEGTISNVKVTGTIDIQNPDGAVISSITDELSDGTVCTVYEDLTYECSLDALPTEPLTNTVTITWSEQMIGEKHLSAGSASFTSDPIVFTGNDIDECVTVTDTLGGALGQVCVGDDNPYVFEYSNTVSVPQWNCVTYDNTATFTTNDTETTGSDSQSVRVCGPMKTGALTMGFWQNKNGQALITGANCANLYNFLRQYAPFQDLNLTTCKTSGIATYVTNVIKAANASGASMNAMLKAQMLATALDVYFFDIGGYEVDLTMICTDLTCTAFQNSGPAFGGASSLTISQMLSYAASQSNVGGTMWYANVKYTQELAKDAFDAINNQKVFAP